MNFAASRKIANRVRESSLVWPAATPASSRSIKFEGFARGAAWQPSYSSAMAWLAATRVSRVIGTYSLSMELQITSLP